MNYHRRDILKRAALLGAAGALTTIDRVSAAPAKTHDLTGIWEMSVKGSAVYRYKYAISPETWVATGDIDQKFLEYKFSPTVGAYARKADGSYRYRETGWTYTLEGVCNGTFESVGTFVVDSSGKSFSGPGTFKMLDLDGKVNFTEDITAKATKLVI
jgi:hypothetical protein